MRATWAVLLAVLLVACTREPPPYESKYTTPAEQQFTAESISAAIRANTPRTITVIGDSTSRQDGAWLYRVADHVATTFGRSVIVNDWDDTANSYTETKQVGSNGVPVTVWNGSAGGQSAQYALQWWPQLVPEPSDLTIINHTHNNPWHAVEGIEKLVADAKGNTKPGGGVVVMLQNPRTDDPERAALEQQVTDELRAKYAAPDSDMIVVDVNTAFRQAGDLTALLKPDGAHPSEQGAQLWADTVIQALKLN